MRAVIEEMRFVCNHYRNIERVAVVADGTILTIAPKIAEHFAHPELKVFRSDERANALARLERADTSRPKL